MASVEKIIAAMRNNPKNVRYEDLKKVREFYFGPARSSGSSHAVFKTPWICDPRVNIQNKGSMAKVYQVKQVLVAIERRESENGS